MRSLGRYSFERQTTQPTPTYESPNLCPDVLIETTRGMRKSHLRFGVAKGAMNPPDAPSTWIGTEMPVLASYSSRRRAISSTGS